MYGQEVAGLNPALKKVRNPKGYSIGETFTEQGIAEHQWQEIRGVRNALT